MRRLTCECDCVPLISALVPSVFCASSALAHAHGCDSAHMALWGLCAYVNVFARAKVCTCV
jgi:hypothetical protein